MTPPAELIVTPSSIVARVLFTTVFTLAEPLTATVPAPPPTTIKVLTVSLFSAFTFTPSNVVVIFAPLAISACVVPVTTLTKAEPPTAAVPAAVIVPTIAFITTLSVA